MNFIKAFSFQKEKAFATELANLLAKDVSPELMQKKRKALSVNKITRLLEKTYASVRKYQQDNRMGFLRRTVFANTFQWALKSHGYPEDFATMATEGLVVTLMKKQLPENE